MGWMWLGQSPNRVKTVQPGTMMCERVEDEGMVTVEAQGSGAAHGRLRADRIAMAVATGALLGVLAAMPYDQMLGISGPACAILRSVLTTAVWAGLRSEQPRDLNFSAAAPEADAPGEHAPQRGHVQQMGEGWKGNLVWFQNVLKVRVESILAHHGG